MSGWQQNQIPYPAGTASYPNKYERLVPRRDVVTFFYPLHNDFKIPGGAPYDPKALSLTRDLFLWGLAGMQQAEPDDPWSFFQIAGIHGLPYQPYDGDDSTGWEEAWKERKAEGWWGGYCHHGDALFPTWHRPYVLLFERAVIHWAVEKVKAVYAGKTSDPSYNDHIKAAEDVRLPYLDWAGSYVRVNGLPNIFVDPTVTVEWPTETTLPNPLKYFMMPQDVGKLVPSGAQYNPYAKPTYVPPPSDTPFTPKGYNTVRFPTAAYQSNADAVQTSLMRGCNLSLRNNLYHTFPISDWARFSNHNSTAAGDPEAPEHSETYGHFNSIEVVHDMVHDFIGGPGGHMGYPDVAGFDPIFFFHHANVDRILALWQYCWDPYAIPSTNPTAGSIGVSTTAWLPNTEAESTYVDQSGTFSENPDSKLYEGTELRPFRKQLPNGTNTWFTSKDVRNYEKDINLTLTELQDAHRLKWKPGDMLAYLLELYKPMNDTRIKWFVNLAGIPKLYYGSPYMIRVFIDLPTATSTTPETDVHYAGKIYVFARHKSVKCINCGDNSTIKGSVEITATLLNLGIVSNPEIGTNISEGGAIPDLNLYSDSITLVYVSSDGVTPLAPPIPAPLQTVTWTIDLGSAIMKLHSRKDIVNLAFPGQAGWVKGKQWGEVPIAIKPAPHTHNG